MANTVTMAAIIPSTIAADRSPCCAQTIPKNKIAPSQTANGWKSGEFLLPGCLLINEGAINIAINKDTTSQPVKFDGGAPCHVAGNFVGVHSQ